MSKKEIFAYLTNNLSGYTAREMVMNLAVTIVLALFIYLVYALTNRKVNYTSGFGAVLILTAATTAVIMIIIESNLVLSLGMVGALSIIRFRSAIKDPLDTAYIFWAVAVGISSGTGNHLLSLLACAVFGVVLVAFSLIGRKTAHEILILRGPGFDSAAVEQAMAEHKTKSRPKSRSINPGAMEYIFEVSACSDALMNRLAEVPGVETVNVVKGVEL